MYLKELTISGFKSFSHKSELEFVTPITAIVGPNGSGKSNVAEAFRFVLGEQSVKSMRGKRGEDLIWGGSDALARGNRASVRVVFDNIARGLAVDFDEVRIERVVHRDGQNEYKINDSVVRLKDVHELLAGAHIGATGHHIISQGEADRVISAGSKERREMIEDALGLKIFQIKKQEAIKKLEKTEHNIAETESLRREAAPHLRYLKKQVERAERAIAVKTELQTAYAAYLRREDTYLALRLANLQTEKRPLAADLTKTTERMAGLQDQIAAAEMAPDTTKLQTAESNLQVAEQGLRDTERSLNTLLGQISFLERRIEEQSTQSIEAKEELIPRGRVVELVNQVENAITPALITDDIQFIKQTLTHTVDTLTAFVARAEVVSVDTVADDEVELARVRIELPALEQAHATATTKVAEARAAVTTARNELETKGQQQVAAERELFTVIDAERQLRQRLVEIDRELENIERSRQDFKREIQEAVALIGRGAMEYANYVLTGENGETLTDEAILTEPRSEQQARRHKLEKLKIRLEELGLGDTTELLKEYEDAKARDAFLAGELSDLADSVEHLQALINDLDEQLQARFVAGIETISLEFNKFFSLMFGGGSAGLRQVTSQVKEVDEETVVASIGVELAVSLPNKRVRGLDMLSGGERALTSIALIFAMSQVNPPPFIILDETDAALDEANSRRYGDMIAALATKSQLILITHNRETMSRAGVLYGITMGSDGASKILSVQFEEAERHAK